MTKAELIKKIHALEKEVSELSTKNKSVLDAHQSLSQNLSQYIRSEEERLRNLREELMLQVQALRHDAARLDNDYRQERNNLRNAWAKTFLFNASNAA